MKINGVEYYKVQRIPDGKKGRNAVLIRGKQYEVRFTADNARHIIGNEKDPQHLIKIEDTLNVFKESIVILIPEGQMGKSLALGRHPATGTIYMMVFIYHPGKPGLIDIFTAYKCSNHNYRLLYDEYERQNK